MDAEDIRRGIEAILFAAGEPVGAERMALAIGVSAETIHQEVKVLQDELSFGRRGIRIITLEDAYQMVSAAEQSELITRALETRKPPRLSASALETLTVIAYYQIDCSVAEKTVAGYLNIAACGGNDCVGILLSETVYDLTGFSVCHICDRAGVDDANVGCFASC